MIDINLFEKHNIIICPDEKKTEILKFTNFLDNDIKFITKDEIKKNFIFNYDDNALIYLMKKENISLEGAKELITNCYYAVKGFDKKLDHLVDIREELLEKGLIERDNFFKYIFNNKKIFVYGYSSKDKELAKLIKLLNIEVTYIEEKDYVSHDVLVFNDIEEEVDYFFNKVLELVDNGIDISSIKLSDYNKENYEVLLWKYASIYNVKIGFKNQDDITMSPYFKRFLELYESNSLQDSYNLLIEEVKVDSYRFLDALKRLLISIYGLFDNKEEEKKYLLEKAKNTKLSSIRFDKQIDIVSSTYSPDDYIFILGFNNGDYPKINKDIDYLNDKEKAFLEINTTNDQNILNNEQLINFLNSHHHLFISLKENIGKEVYFESTLIDSLKMNKVKPLININRYSTKSSAIEVCKSKDDYINYGFKSNNYNAMDIEYKTYDHHFKGGDHLKNNGNLQVSYTSIQTYNECPFAYFVSYVLGANCFEGNFNTNLGTAYHALLELSVANNTRPTLDDLINIQIKDGETVKSFNDLFPEPAEKFFAKKLFNNLLEVIDKNNEFLLESSVNTKKVEQELIFSFDDDTILKGSVDKMLLDTNNNYLAIVDYKTGGFHFNSKKVEYGINMQLPIYAILAKHNYPSYKVAGLYIQNVLTNEEETEKNYLLGGITLDDLNIVSKFVDINEIEKYIAQVKINKDGELDTRVKVRTNRLMTEDEFDSLVNLTMEKVKETIKNIREGNYPIRPKNFDGKESRCANCEFKDLCFMEPSDYEEITLKDEKEGDNDGN
jgi:hypothetical protein